MILKEDDFTEIGGVGKKTEEKLKNAGFKTYKDLEKASVEQLTSVKGIYVATAERIKDYFKEQSLVIKLEDSIEEKIEETSSKIITSRNLDKYIKDIANGNNHNSNRKLLEDHGESNESGKISNGSENFDVKKEVIGIEDENSKNEIENYRKSGNDGEVYKEDNSPLSGVLSDGNKEVINKVRKEKDKLIEVSGYDKKFEGINSENKDHEEQILNEEVSKLPDYNHLVGVLGNDEVKVNDSTTLEGDSDQVKALEVNNREELGVEDYDDNEFDGDFSKLPVVGRLLKKELKTVSNVIDEFISDDKIELEEEPTLPQEEKKKSRLELLSDIGVQKLINTAKDVLKSKEFYVLSPKIKGIDLLAIKIVKAKNLIDYIVIIPLKMSNLKGSIIVSNEALKYVSADHLPKQVLILIQKKYLDVLVKGIVKVPNIIYDNLCREGSIFKFLKSYLKLKIKVEKSRSGTVLFFREGSLQFKILVEPVIICQGETNSSENSIAFPYFPERNLHVINCNKLQNLVDYLEVKYITIEKYNKKKDNDIVQYFRVKNKTINRLRLLSVPFAFYGGIFLLLVVFQLFEAIRVFTLLSYGVLSIYFLIIMYLYYNFYSEKKRIITKAKEPYFKRKIEVDDYDLNFIKEELDYDSLNQFFFECIDSESKIRSSFSLIKSVKTDKIEKKSQYGTFLED